MTILNQTAKLAPAVTGLTVDPGIGSTILAWDTVSDPSFSVVEIWRATVNNRASATKVGEARASFTDTGLTPGTPYYYWVRTKNTVGRSNGPWEPTSPTGGVSSTPLEVVTEDIEVDATTSLVVSVDDNDVTISSGTYGSYISLVDINITGHGFPTIIHFSDIVNPGSANLNSIANGVWINYEFKLMDTTTSPHTEIVTNTYTCYMFRGVSGFLETWQFPPVDRIVFTLEDGHTYNYTVKFSKNRSTGSDTLGAVISQYRVYTIQEIKR
jgi:hypothetical protein